VYGSLQLNRDPVGVKSAAAVAMDYSVAADAPKAVAMAWYAEFITLMKGANQDMQHIEVRMHAALRFAC
jgi:hypothetical protein